MGYVQFSNLLEGENGQETGNANPVAGDNDIITIQERFMGIKPLKLGQNAGASTIGEML